MSPQYETLWRRGRLMPRYRLTLEYDGGPFSGWQRQDNGPSVQGALEDAIFALSGERVTVTGAGRTDAGVHARGQVAHFDLAKDFRADKVRDALNHFLRPQPVAVLDGGDRAGRFPCALFGDRRGIIAIASSAAARRWRSIAGRAWHVVRALDAEAHARGGADACRPARFHDVPRRGMPGEIAGEDARSARCPRAGDEIFIEASARSFLHNQVRISWVR